jgi:UDP-3-O-[3-hydroxymyristoyl] glucosamine N-acyltransferase
MIRDIAPLDRARSTDISFLDNPKYLDALATTRAGACLTAQRFAAQAPDKLALLVAPEPYRASTRADALHATLDLAPACSGAQVDRN